jgi:serine/threonine protein kinase
MSEQCHVMHRDIKLENILVKKHKGRSTGSVRDFVFKIADMGLAKGHFGDNVLNQTTCGTPMYMAPEVLLKRPYNGLADVWSLGTLLYHMLTGKYPFRARNLNELK